MSVRIIEGTDGYKAIYDSVTMTAFGPIFYDEDDVDDLLEWLPEDARTYGQHQLNDLVHQWRQDVKMREAERAMENRYEGDGNFADNH